jgi:hydroxymethylpyrimidine pyrophosphatase-like HAD family hydrolase
MEEGGIVLIKNEEFIRSNEKWQTYISSLPQGLTYASGEVLLITDEHSLEPLTKRASEMGVEFELQPYKSWYFLTPKGVNKLSSVIYAINRMGEDGLTMFVGDELNDLQLIQWADCSIAVGNANEKVKRESDVVLNGNDGEGIKELLRSLLSDSFRC